MTLTMPCYDYGLETKNRELIGACVRACVRACSSLLMAWKLGIGIGRDIDMSIVLV